MVNNRVFRKSALFTETEIRIALQAAMDVIAVSSGCVHSFSHSWRSQHLSASLTNDVFYLANALEKGNA